VTATRLLCRTPGKLCSSCSFFTGILPAVRHTTCTCASLTMLCSCSTPGSGCASSPTTSTSSRCSSSCSSVPRSAAALGPPPAAAKRSLSQARRVQVSAVVMVVPGVHETDSCYLARVGRRHHMRFAVEVLHLAAAQITHHNIPQYISTLDDS
jgi:hypothetical protein